MDINTTTITSLASDKMKWASERQKLVAQNIANADTPDYKAKDLVPFSQVLSSVSQVSPARTHPSHLGGGSSETNFPMAKQGNEWGASISGNNVILEEQMLKASETKGSYDMAATLYQKSMNMMQATFGRQ